MAQKPAPPPNPKPRRTAPRESAPIHQPHTRDMILQSELLTLLNLDHAFSEVALSIRRRSRAGAAVEPGAWDINDEPGPIDEYEGVTGLTVAGLLVTSTAEIARQRARMERINAEQQSATAPQPTTPAEAQPRPDPLRAEVYKLEESQAAALSTHLRALITGAVAEMDVSHLQEVARFIDIAEHAQGCSTPAEEFIVSLVSDCYREGGLTPEVAMHELKSHDGFQVNFKDALDIAKRYAVMYPALVLPPAGGPEN